MKNDDDDMGAQWRKFEAMARRGFDRLTGSMSEGNENLGSNFRMGRMLAAGDVRLVALFLIEQQPRHGYDLIKAIEERSHGFYSPGPGMIYPALTYLEEAGFVTSQSEANKKVYTISDSGRAHLSDNREAIERTLNFLARAGERMQQFREWSFGNGEAPAEGDDPRGRGPGGRGGRGPHRGGPGRHGGPGGWRFGGPPDRDIEDVLPEVNEARRALKDAIREAVSKGEDVQRKLAEILRKAAEDIGRQVGDDIDL